MSQRHMVLLEATTSTSTETLVNFNRRLNELEEKGWRLVGKVHLRPTEWGDTWWCVLSREV